MTLHLISDENISWRLKKLLPDWNILPSNEIKPDYRLTDSMIWKFAKANNYSILTFDEDFSGLQNLYSFPPKLFGCALAIPQLQKFLSNFNMILNNF